VSLLSVPPMPASANALGPAGPDHDSRAVERLLWLVRSHLDAEVAWVSAFADGQQVIHAASGEVAAMNIPVGEGTDLQGSYCTRVVAGTLPPIIADARRHPVTRDLPVTRELRIGSYIGVPWHGPGGAEAGMLCCVSRNPDPSLDGEAVRFMTLIAELISDHMGSPLAQQRQAVHHATQTVRTVLDQRAIQMVFQPVVKLADGVTVAYEALARFNPDIFASPDRAFAAATQSGLGTDLELLAVQRALERLPDLPDETWLCVNLSADALLTAAASDILLAHAGNHLVIEVTEHTQIDDYAKLRHALKDLRSAGLKLSIDDAGAGFASLNHILQLRPDIIKLDISLVRDIDTDPARAALARSLVSFAADTDAELIAEGIETAAERSRLAELGLSYGQGFHLARPADLPGRSTADRPGVGPGRRPGRQRRQRGDVRGQNT
jgi:EAL domain-containing protein (putative c-di-GMP-specific phosphodiesterase class I)